MNKLIEKYTRTLELEIGSSDGAPYRIKTPSFTGCVTRRCAINLWKSGRILSAQCVRDRAQDLQVRAPGTGNHAAALTLSITVKPTGRPGVWMIRCPEMKYEAPTKDVSRCLMLLTCEAWERTEFGAESATAQLAGEWRSK